MINLRKLKRYIYNNYYLFSFICWYRSILHSSGLIRILNTNSKYLGYLLIFIISPIFLILEIIFIIGYGRNKTKSINHSDLTKQYKYELALVAIIKDEDPYLTEWIEYHLLIGVKHFYIYDNGASKETEKILSIYINEGIVEYIPFPGLYMQCKAYTDAINKYGYLCKFMGFIDLDEFILVNQPDIKTTDFIKKLMKEHPYASGIAISWLNFGSNYHKTKPKGLVIENYLRRAPKSFMLNVKTIVNPRLVVDFSSPHYPNYKYGGYSINEKGNKVYSSFDFYKSVEYIRINHYFTKSEEECKAKFNKGFATHKGKRSWNDFTTRDKNDIYDDTILRYLTDLKENIKNRKLQ